MLSQEAAETLNAISGWIATIDDDVRRLREILSQHGITTLDLPRHYTSIAQAVDAARASRRQTLGDAAPRDISDFAADATSVVRNAKAMAEAVAQLLRRHEGTPGGAAVQQWHDMFTKHITGLDDALRSLQQHVPIVTGGR